MIAHAHAHRTHWKSKRIHRKLRTQNNLKNTTRYRPYMIICATHFIYTYIVDSRDLSARSNKDDFRNVAKKTPNCILVIFISFSTNIIIKIRDVLMSRNRKRITAGTTKRLLRIARFSYIVWCSLK